LNLFPWLVDGDENEQCERKGGEGVIVSLKSIHQSRRDLRVWLRCIVPDREFVKYVIPRIEGARRFFPFSSGPIGLTNDHQWITNREMIVGEAPHDGMMAKQPTREGDSEVNSIRGITIMLCESHKISTRLRHIKVFLLKYDNSILCTRRKLLFLTAAWILMLDD
jgi:hypothetical protein